MQLSGRRCSPCRGEKEQPLRAEDADNLLRGLPGGRIEKGRLRRDYAFGTFVRAVGFRDRIADIATREEHTPDVCIEDYDKMRLSLYTYCCNGLTENDFILAAKIGEAFQKYRDKK